LLFVWDDVCFVCCEHFALDGGVSETGYCPADEEEDHSPREKMGGNEEDESGDECEEEKG